MISSRSAVSASRPACSLSRCSLSQQCSKRQRVAPPAASNKPQHDVAPPSMSFLQPGPFATDKPAWDTAPAASTRTDHDIVLAISNVETLGDLYNFLSRNSDRFIPEHYCTVLLRLVELMPSEGQRGPFPQQGARAADANRVLAAMMPDLQRQLPYFATDQLAFLLGLLPDMPSSVDKDLVGAICRVACKCFCESGRLSSCPSTSLATVAWALAMLRYWNEFTWQQLANAISRKLATFTAPELSHTACAFAVAQRYQPQLFDAIAGQAMARLQMPSEREVPGPALILGAPSGPRGRSRMATTSRNLSQSGRGQTGTTSRPGSPSLDGFSSSDLAMLMWSFASVKHYDAALLTAMSRQICIRLEGNTPLQGRDLLAEALNAKYWLRYPVCLPLSDLTQVEGDNSTTSTTTPPEISTPSTQTSSASSSASTQNETNQLGPSTSGSSSGLGSPGSPTLLGMPTSGSSTLSLAAEDVEQTVEGTAEKSDKSLLRGLGAKLKLELQQLTPSVSAGSTASGGLGEGSASGRPGASRDDVERMRSGQECSTSESCEGGGVDAFKPVEVAQLAWSYAQLKYHDKPLLGLLGQAIMARTSQYNEKDLYDILMAYTWINHHDPVLTKTLCGCLAPKTHLLPLTNLTAVMFALARAHKHRPWEVYQPSFWEAAAQLFPSRVPDMKFGELARVVWAFAALRHHDPVVMDAVANQVPLKCNASQPGGLTMMVQAYATLNCYNTLVFGAIVQVALRRLADFNCFQLGALAGAFALVDWQDMAIFQGIYKRLQNMDVGMFDGDPDALRQLFQADLVLRLLHQNTIGRPRLPPQFVQKPMRRSQVRNSTHRNVPRLTAELYRAMLRKGVRPTLGAPSEDKLMAVDLSLKWRGKHDVALQAGVQGCYTVSKPHLPLGSVRTGQRLLQARGLKVVMVPFFEWEAVNGDIQAQDVLLDQHLSVLG